MPRCPLLAAGAMRFRILPIRLLRLLGYESAEETVAVRHRGTAVNQLPMFVAQWLPLAEPEGKLSGVSLTDEVFINCGASRLPCVRRQ